MSADSTNKTLLEISSNIGTINGKLEHVATKTDLSETKAGMIAAIQEHADTCDKKSTIPVPRSSINWMPLIRNLGILLGAIAAAIGGTIASQ